MGPRGRRESVDPREVAMERILERCAALDVHKQQVTACAHVPDSEGRRAELRAEFSTMTSELLALRDWLLGLGVTHVAMEAAGVYWKPVYYLLEDDFELWLVNAQHVKNVPGRKTDVQDAQWLCQLLEHGLVRASFVPPKPIRELRDLTRYRKSLTWERQREANRLQKLLEDANIKLGDVASDVLGASGRAMLEELCAGNNVLPQSGGFDGLAWVLVERGLENLAGAKLPADGRVGHPFQLQATASAFGAQAVARDDFAASADDELDRRKLESLERLLGGGGESRDFC